MIDMNRQRCGHTLGLMSTERLFPVAVLMLAQLMKNVRKAPETLRDPPVAEQLLRSTRTRAARLTPPLA